MKTPELKPCPFCGGGIYFEKIDQREHSVHIRCLCCEMEFIYQERYSVFKDNMLHGYVPTVSMRENLSFIEAWNRRADNEN